MIGKIKWFDDHKGYGFIEYNEYEDIFVHYTNILQDGYKTLEKGQLVSFQLIETAKGLQAHNISIVKEM